MSSPRPAQGSRRRSRNLGTDIRLRNFLPTTTGNRADQLEASAYRVMVSPMNGDIITAMLAPLIFFEQRCDDKATLRKLIALANDKARRKQAHVLFNEIRNKTLAAQRSGNQLAEAQYAFEEICAKTLYNITLEPAPFDPDSPFWVLPRALKLGQMLGVTDAGVISPLLKAK